MSMKEQANAAIEFLKKRAEKERAAPGTKAPGSKKAPPLSSYSNMAKEYAEANPQPPATPLTPQQQEEDFAKQIPGFYPGSEYGKLLSQRYMYQPAGGYQSAIQDVMQRYQNRLGGMTAQEQGALRSNLAGEIGGQAGALMSDYSRKMANQGVSGPAGAAAYRDIADKAFGARAKAENQIAIQNMELKRQALLDYDKALTAERQGNLAQIYGAGTLGVQAAAASRQNDLLDQYVRNTKEGAEGAGDEGSSGGMDIGASVGRMNPFNPENIYGIDWYGTR